MSAISPRKSPAQPSQFAAALFDEGRTAAYHDERLAWLAFLGHDGAGGKVVSSAMPAMTSSGAVAAGLEQRDLA